MERIEKTVFISYRRTNFPWALAIFKDLEHHGYDVFFDFSGIASGDFESVILRNIKARAHFLVVLTPSALEHSNEPGDWLRREIETALGSKRNIVPLFLKGFDFGNPKIASQLTGRLAELKRYNGLDIVPRFFDAGMELLRNKYLKVPLSAVLHPISPSAQRATKKQKAAAGVAPRVQKQELTAQQWIERGFAAVDIDEKLRCFTKAIRLKTDFAEAFYNRGLTRYAKGDLEGAQRDYTRAIQRKGDFAEAFYGRGLARYAKGELEGALRDYGRAIQRKGDFAEAFYGRGLARRAKGDGKGAQQDFDQAKRLGYG